MIEVIIGNHYNPKEKLATPKITTYTIMVKNAKSSEYQSCGQIQKNYSIRAHTLRSWADSGILQPIRLSANGKRLYPNCRFTNERFYVLIL
jgi:hypothetical protein